MFNRTFILASVCLAVAACGLARPAAPASPLSPHIPVDQPVPTGTHIPVDQPVPTGTHIPVDLPVPIGTPELGAWTPAELAAAQWLATDQNLPLETIRLVSSEPIDWPDGCLGVVRMGVLCAQGIVPGFRLVFTAAGQSYEFHTNQDGSSLIESPVS